MPACRDNQTLLRSHHHRLLSRQPEKKGGGYKNRNPRRVNIHQSTLVSGGHGAPDNTLPRACKLAHPWRDALLTRRSPELTRTREQAMQDCHLHVEVPCMPSLGRTNHFPLRSQRSTVRVLLSCR